MSLNELVHLFPNDGDTVCVVTIDVKQCNTTSSTSKCGIRTFINFVTRE
jgi:hypothetical protein